MRLARHGTGEQEQQNIRHPLGELVDVDHPHHALRDVHAARRLEAVVADGMCPRFQQTHQLFFLHAKETTNKRKIDVTTCSGERPAKVRKAQSVACAHKKRCTLDAHGLWRIVCE